jgi:hypothetical protein
MEIRRDRRHEILKGLYGALLVATASVLYAMFMAVWSSASLFTTLDFIDRRRAQS